MASPQITVDQFLAVREHLAMLLKDHSTTQKPTRLRQAEHLLQAGVIDIHAVLDEIEDRQAPVYAQIES